MKILVVGHQFIVDENRLFWAQFAKFHNYDVDIITPKSWSSGLEKKMSFSKSNEDNHFNQIFQLETKKTGNGSLYTFSSSELSKVLSSHKYDFIFFLEEVWSLSLLQFNVIKLFSKNKNTPFLFYAAQNIKKWKLLFMRPIEWFNAFLSSGSLFVNETVLEINKWKLLPCKNYFFPLSFDEAKYSLNSRHRERVTIGYLGRLSQEKGVRDLLNLVSEFPDFEFHIAGAGPLEEEIKQLQKKHSNLLFQGRLAHSKAYEFYQNIDIFILPSKTTKTWKEQFGRVLIEAAVSGNLVIGSSSGSIPSVLKSVEMPFIFNESSFEDLKDVLLKTVGILKSEQAQSIQSNTIRKSVEIYSNKSVVQRMNNYILEVLSNR